MRTVTLELDEDFLALLGEPDRPFDRAAIELMVLELYRRRAVSSGWAAERLGMGRIDFIRYASDLGIPFIEMSEDEWAAEKREIARIVGEDRLLPTPVP